MNPASSNPTAAPSNTHRDLFSSRTSMLSRHIAFPWLADCDSSSFLSLSARIVNAKMISPSCFICFLSLISHGPNSYIFKNETGSPGASSFLKYLRYPSSYSAKVRYISCLSWETSRRLKHCQYCRLLTNKNVRLTDRETAWVSVGHLRSMQPFEQLPASVLGIRFCPWYMAWLQQLRGPCC